MATTRALHQLTSSLAAVATSSEVQPRKNGSPSKLNGSSISILTGSSFKGSVSGLLAQGIEGVSSRQHCGARAAVSVKSSSALAKQRKNQYEITTFTTWLLQQEQAGIIDGELTIVLSSISLACKQIASLVQRAGISDLTGLQGAANIQGEEQKKLDVISNEVFSSCLRSSGPTAIIASEEEDTPVAVEESYSGHYIVVFDPLDGSANIDAAVSAGSIFGMYESNEECLTNFSEDPTVEYLNSSSS